jgi:uncharacterized protein (DUF2237 family)
MGLAPPIVPEATHESLLRFVELDVLKRYGVVPAKKPPP